MFMLGKWAADSITVMTFTDTPRTIRVDHDPWLRAAGANTPPEVTERAADRRS
jgi:hypothetical protein